MGFTKRKVPRGKLHLVEIKSFNERKALCGATIKGFIISYIPKKYFPIKLSMNTIGCDICWAEFIKDAK